MKFSRIGNFKVPHLNYAQVADVDLESVVDVTAERVEETNTQASREELMNGAQLHDLNHTLQHNKIQSLIYFFYRIRLFLCRS